MYEWGRKMLPKQWCHIVARFCAAIPLSCVWLTSCHQYDSFLNSLHTLLEIKHWQRCDTHLVSKKTNKQATWGLTTVCFKKSTNDEFLYFKNAGNHRKWGTVHENVQPSCLTRNAWQEGFRDKQASCFYMSPGIKMTQYSLRASQNVKCSIEML